MLIKDEFSTIPSFLGKVLEGIDNTSIIYDPYTFGMVRRTVNSDNSEGELVYKGCIATMGLEGLLGLTYRDFVAQYLEKYPKERDYLMGDTHPGVSIWWREIAEISELWEYYDIQLVERLLNYLRIGKVSDLFHYFGIDSGKELLSEYTRRIEGIHDFPTLDQSRAELQWLLEQASRL